jgi:Protein of unknown function (DUF429)
MSLGELELEEDEPPIEPRPPVDDAVFAQIESVAERETEGAAEFGGDLFAVIGGSHQSFEASAHWSIGSDDSAASIVAGADACGGGWVAIVLDDGSVAIRSSPRRSSGFSAGATRWRQSPSTSRSGFGKKILEGEGHWKKSSRFSFDVSFAALAGRHLRYSKRSWNGQMERRRVLGAAGIELPDELSAGQAAADDVLDAAIAAWSAARKAREARRCRYRPPTRARWAAGRDLVLADQVRFDDDGAVSYQS